jgi:RsiW-degrading membrane proteinase PrsW (M82 family)
MTLQLAGALVVIVTLTAVVFLALWVDRFKGEPVMRLVMMALWGGACGLALRLAAPALASFGRAGVAAWFPPSLTAGVPVVEELLLAAGLAILATSHVLDGPLDGAAYGTVTGLGFAAFQVFASLATASSPSQTGVSIVAVLGQAGATALVGGAFGLAKLTLRAALRVPAVLAAALLGGLYQGGLVLAGRWARRTWPESGGVFDCVLGALSIVILLAVAQTALTFERRVLVRQLAEEVNLGVLPEWVTTVIPRYAKRVRSAWWPRRDERREVVRLLTSLAYRKQQLLGLSEFRANLYGLEVGRLRQRARTLLALDRPSRDDGESET